MHDAVTISPGDHLAVTDARRSCPKVVMYGLGLAVPKHQLSQSVACDFAIERNATTARQARWMKARYQRSGVAQRYTVLPIGTDAESAMCLTDFFPPPRDLEDRGPTTAERMHAYRCLAPSLAAEAVRVALADASVDPTAVDHIVMVSCTGFMAPGIEIDLIEQLGLRSNIARTNLGFMGCHGAINGLRCATSIATASPGDVVLLVCVELCSLHFQYGFRPDQVVANALFGDGAAALLVRAISDEQAAGLADDLRICDSASIVLPDSRDLMGWTIGDHGFEMRLSEAVPEMIERSLRPFLAEWLANHGLTPDEVAGWAVHPGGPRIIDAAERCLALPAGDLDSSRAVLTRIGNVSSGTVLWVLQELLNRGVSGPIVLLAFGPGLSIEAALLTTTR